MIFLLFAVAVLSSQPEEPSPLCPNGVSVRKEFRDMTEGEWIQFLRALVRMYHSENGELSRIDRLTKVHLANVPEAHM